MKIGGDLRVSTFDDGSPGGIEYRVDRDFILDRKPMWYRRDTAEDFG